MCDPTWGDAAHPADQGCHYFTITREAQGTVDPKNIEGDQTGFEGAVAADAQCRLSWDETEFDGEWDDTPDQVRVRLYVPGTNYSPAAAGNAWEYVIPASSVTNDTYGTHTFGGAGHYTFPCGLDDNPFATGGTAYFGAVEVWMDLEQTLVAGGGGDIIESLSTDDSTHNVCGVDTDGATGCPGSLAGSTDKLVEIHPGYLRADVESSTTTRIEANGGSTNVTTLNAGDVPNARLDWSSFSETQEQEYPLTGCGTGSAMCGGGKSGYTPVALGYLQPQTTAHFLKHGDPFGNWTTSHTCTYNSGNGRCDATFPAVDQSYVNGAAYDVDFEFTGPDWNGIPLFEFRDTGHLEPYPPTVWDSAPDGTVSGPNLLGTPTVTINTTGGATTTTTTAPTGSSGGMLLGWYQGNGTHLSDIETQVAGDKGSSFSFGHARVYIDKGHWSDGVTSSAATENVASLNAAGTAVSLSIQPPAWNGNESPWAQAAADTTQIDADLVALNNDAATNSIPFNTFTVSHEPHDNTSDWIRTNGKPGCTGHSDSCQGTIADYQLLYHNLMAQKMTACSGECTHVKIAYIGVVSNMTRHKNNDTVGSDDPLLPADRDSSGNVTAYNFDILGGDPYNWGCFNEQTAGPDATLNTADDGTNCTSSVNQWTSFQNMVDPSGSYSLMDLAQKYNKPVFLTEVGSFPGCTGNPVDDATYPRLWCNGSSTTPNATTGLFDRGVWFDQMESYLTSNPDALKYIYAIDYFHTDHYDPKNNPSGHDWTFISTAKHTAPLATTAAGTDQTGYSNWLTDFAENSFFKESAVGFVTDFTPNS